MSEVTEATSKKEFVLERIDERICIIATKDQFTENGCMWKEFPMKIHGFIKVEGTSFKKSFTSYMHISDEASPELERLSKMAQEIVFPPYL